MPEQINLDQAVFYIDEHGTILEKARLLYLLMDVEPSPETYTKLLSLQNPDGGFPSRPKGENNPSSVDSTLTSLWQLDELGLFNDPAARHALEYLANNQNADGSWDENPALPQHDLPPWIQPGTPATVLYLTAYTVYWLGIYTATNTASGNEALTSAFQKAAAYLAQQQDSQGKLPGYAHNTWMGTSALLLAAQLVFTHTPSNIDYAQYAQRGLDYLAALPDAGWEDSQLAWATDCLSRAGLTIEHSLIQQLLKRLINRQAADGSWASEDGPANAASATVNALKVIKRLTSLPPLA